MLEYARSRNAIVRKELFAHRRELWLWTSWGFALSAVNVSIVWYGGHLYMAGSASIGDIMAFQWYSFLLLNPVWQIVNSFSELQRSLAATERVFEVLAMPADKPDKPDARDAPPVVHELEFQDVEFEYREGRPVVRDFSIKVPGGSVVALVGRSGAGKTTVTDLVARFHDPTRGRILLNGVDIREHTFAHVPRSARARAAGRVPVRRLRARQHRVRAARRHGCGRRGRSEAGERARVHRALARALRHVHRRTWGEASGANSSAWRSRVRSWRAADPDSRRSDEQSRHGERAADSSVDGDAARGPHDVRHRASLVDDTPRRSHSIAGRRPHRRARHARRAHGSARHLSRDGHAPGRVGARTWTRSRCASSSASACR